MRVIDDVVDVELQDGTPRSLRWQARTYLVRRVLDEWRAAGRWWLNEPGRDYWLLDAYHLTAEIYRQDDTWVLARIGD